MAGTNLGLREDEDALIPTQVNGRQLENRLVTMVSAGSSYTVALAVDKSD